MRKDYQPDELKIKKDLPGMTLKMLQEHFKLYEGYVKKTNEIQKKIDEADLIGISLIRCQNNG